MKPKKIKKIFIFLFVILLFIPLVALGIILKDNFDAKLDSGKIIRAEITSADGTLTVEDSEKIDTLVEAILSGAGIDEANHPLESYVKCELSFFKIKNEFHYTLYLSESVNDCLYTDSEGTLFHIDSGKASLLLALPEIDRSVISYASAPEILLVCGEEKYPACEIGGEWFYRNFEGEEKTEKIEIQNAVEAILPSEKKLEFSFAVEPDFVNVRILSEEGDILLETQELSALESFSRDSDSKLKVILYCDWYENEAKPYSGELEYHFDLFYDLPSSCRAASSIASPDSLFVLEILNSSSESIAVTPGFSAGEVRVISLKNKKIALVPVASDAKTGEFEITLMGSDIDLRLPVSVAEIPREASPSALTALIDGKNELEEILQKLSSESPQEFFASAGFSYPTGSSDGISLGNVDLQNEGGESIPHGGVDIACPPGTLLYAAATGKCVYAGQTALFSNTLILDHGQGIFSLYGALESLNLSVGDEVQKGTAIASSLGFSACGTEGVHFAVYAGETFVDPVSFLSLATAGK